MKRKFLFLASLLFAFHFVVGPAEAGHRYGGYFGGYGFDFGEFDQSYQYGLASRYRSQAYWTFNGGRGHFRDSGHTNLRTYRVYRKQAQKAKKAEAAAEAAERGEGQAPRKLFRLFRKKAQ